MSLGFEYFTQSKRSITSTELEKTNEEYTCHTRYLGTGSRYSTLKLPKGVIDHSGK